MRCVAALEAAFALTRIQFAFLCPYGWCACN
jgi:hypothetical protein